MKLVMREPSERIFRLLCRIFDRGGSDQEFLGLILFSNGVEAIITEQVWQRIREPENLIQICDLYPVSKFYIESALSLSTELTEELREKYLTQFVVMAFQEVHRFICSEGSANEVWNYILQSPLEIKLTTTDEHYFINGISKLAKLVGDCAPESYAQNFLTSMRCCKAKKNQRLALKLILCIGGKHARGIDPEAQHLKAIALIAKERAMGSKERIQPSARSVVLGALRLLNLQEDNWQRLFELLNEKTS